MKTKDFESRIKSAHNDLVFTSNDYLLTVSIENKFGRGMCTHLTIEKVDELKAAIAQWEQLYYSAAEKTEE